MVALILITALAGAPALDEAAARMSSNICEIIQHADRYEGKRVKFFGFLRQDIEMLMVSGPECRENYIVIGADVQGRIEAFLPEVREKKWFVPSGSFQGKVRIVRGDGVTSIILDDALIISSGVSEYPADK